MTGIKDPNFVKYINKIKKINWLHYKLYIVGGILEGWETQDIDICVTGKITKELPLLLNEAKFLGPFDMYWVDKLIKTNDGGFRIYKFAKSYDRGHPKNNQRKGKWKNNLFWQEFKNAKKNKIYKKNPLLIYNGGFVI